MSGRKGTRYLLPDEEGSVTRSELRRIAKEKQKGIMRRWFHQHYTDPVENTPYESAEGGYIYIWGGPYDPREELESEFGSVVREDTIDELADELGGITWEWTGNPDEQEVDDYFIDSIMRSVPEVAYGASVTNVENLLNISVEAVVQQSLLRLLYANVITAMETYLSDLFISKVTSDPILFRRFIEKNKDFQNEKISLSELFRAHEGIEKRVKAYLTGLVWHRLEKVKALFEEVLEIQFPPDLSALFKAILVRHDIVHRNGKSPDGVEHSITRQEILELISVVNQLVNHIESWRPPVSDVQIDI